MRIRLILTYGVMLFIGVSLARAADIQNGFSGIKWAADVAAVAGLSELSVQQDLGYYVRSGDNYTLNDVILGQVIYGFYQGKFFAAFLNVNPGKDAEKIKNYLTTEYGPVRAQLRIDRTIYIWEHGNIKIKLKLYENKPNAKLSIYYTPLSTKLNESRLETDFEKTIKLKSDG